MQFTLCRTLWQLRPGYLGFDRATSTRTKHWCFLWNMLLLATKLPNKFFSLLAMLPFTASTHPSSDNLPFPTTAMIESAGLSYSASCVLIFVFHCRKKHTRAKRIRDRNLQLLPSARLDVLTSNTFRDYLLNDLALWCFFFTTFSIWGSYAPRVQLLHVRVMTGEMKRKASSNKPTKLFDIMWYHNHSEPHIMEEWISLHCMACINKHIQWYTHI